MLTFPEVFTSDDGVAVYPDDEDPNLFYLLAGRPRLRIDASGKPVFRALFWTDDGTAGQPGSSALGLRGALLHFDVNLEVPLQSKEKILEKIKQTGVQQQRVEQMERDERERIQRMARATGADNSSLPKPRVPEIREARFGSIQFTDGNVSLLEERDGEFVKWVSTSGPPSMIGDNNSAFAMRLGPEGAAVWFRALEQDASAIGVRYELKFQARLPSLQIHVWAGSHQLLEVERKADRVIQNMDTGCGDADVERIDVTEVSQKLTEEGLINVEIIKGSAKISDEQVSQLRNTAISLISDRVKEILLHKVRGMTEEERRSSLLKKVTDEVSAFAELRLTQRDVIEWKGNPQATITDFLGGLTGDARKRLITLVDMSQPVVSKVQAQVSAFAPWDGDPGISQVRIVVEYPAGAGDPEATKTFSFFKDTPPQTFSCRRVARDRGMLNYSAIAFVKGAQEPIQLSRGQTNGDVHVEAPLLGSFKVKLRPHPDMFASSGSGKITSITVDYRYKEPTDPDHVNDRAVIRPADVNDGVSISRTTFRMITHPVRFQPTYQREGAPAIIGKEQQTWVQPGQVGTVEIPLPWSDFLHIGVSSLAVDNLKRIRVDLKYDDGDFQSQGSLMLDAEAEESAGGAWTGKTSLPQLDKTKQRFRYRYTVEGVGQLVAGPWVEAEGDQQLLLPVLGVRIRSDRLKLGTDFTEALLRLKYVDRERRFEAREEFFLTKEQPTDVWLVPRIDANVDQYTYTLTLFRQDGSKEELEGEDRGENLILRPPA